MSIFWRLVSGILGGFLIGCASVAPSLPTESPEGLTLQPDTDASAVYLRDGVDFGSYDEIGLGPCHVAFRKDWLRDQNSSRLDLSNRVTQQDVDRMRDWLADACDRAFAEALDENDRFRVVQSYDAGERVLVLRPSIIGLDVAAPDIRGPGVSRTYVASAGEMTLLLEVLDGTTGELLARVLDRRRAPENPSLQWSSGVTNRAEANRMLDDWASRLSEALDAATR